MSSTSDKHITISVLKRQGGLLEDHLRPQACYRCLLFAFEAFCRDPSIRHAARLLCHAFWDASVRVLTAPRTEADINSLRAQVAKNVAECRYKRQHTARLTSRADPVHLFITALYCLLSEGLLPSTEGHGILHGRDPKKAFVNRRLWPVRPNDFVPFGERQTAEAHVRWCCELVTPGAMRLLSCILIGYRPILFPSLLADDLRERLVWALVQMLRSDRVIVTTKDDFGWSPHISAQPPPGPKQVWLSAQGGHMSVRVATKFLEIVFSGPDSHPDDGVRFSRGYERALLPAIHAALDLAEAASLDEPGIMCLMRWSYYMHARLDFSPKPPLHPLATQRILASQQSTQSASGIWTFETLQTGLQRMYLTRTCYGPACGKGIHETPAGTAFPLCAQCKFTQYCSRECQRADWRHATYPHKQFCHILRCVLSSLAPSATADDFKAAMHRLHSGDRLRTYDPESTKRFMDWVMARGLIHNKVLADGPKSLN